MGRARDNVYNLLYVHFHLLSDAIQMLSKLEAKILLSQKEKKLIKNEVIYLLK